MITACIFVIVIVQSAATEHFDATPYRPVFLRLRARLEPIREDDASSKPVYRTDRPIIGVLTTPVSQQWSAALSVDNRSTYIASAYVSLYESVGARIAPIPFDLNREGLKALFDQVNALLIPGGAADLTEASNQPRYKAAAAYLLQLAREANDAGTYFPVHGTCLGFEVLAIQTAEDDNILCGKGCLAASGVPLTWNLQPGAKASQLFQAFSSDLQRSLVQENVTFHSHSNGVLLSSFMSSAKMTDFWHLVSTSQDLLGKEFVSTLEAKHYPITATQWHPEKPAYEFVGIEGLRVPHTEKAIAIGAVMARDFVARAKLNPHRFESIAAEEAALIDKRGITYDPTRFFSSVYLTGLAGMSTYQGTHGAQWLQDSQGEPIGIPKLEWLPMSIEVEMLECPSVYSPSSELLYSETLEMRNQSTVAEWVQSTSAPVRRILQSVPASQTLSQHPGRLANLRSLHVKSGHDAEGLLDQWNWEAEKSGKGELELTSPKEMSEEEVNFAINVSSYLIGSFYGFQYSSLQAHVDGRCLLSEDRLLGLLLLWEKYHDALERLIQVRWRGKDFARSLSHGNPKLLRSLQQRWEQRTAVEQEEPLHELFTKHELDIRDLKDDRDGYRNFAVNICHLLNINCCINCPKNLTPKFGGVEFRMFNTEFGKPMRLAMTFFQRLVQRSCSAPLEDLRAMTFSTHQTPAVDAAPLFEFLQMDVPSMNDSFLQSGAERWLWFCSLYI